MRIKKNCEKQREVWGQRIEIGAMSNLLSPLACEITHRWAFVVNAPTSGEREGNERMDVADG